MAKAGARIVGARTRVKTDGTPEKNKKHWAREKEAQQDN